MLTIVCQIASVVACKYSVGVAYHGEPSHVAEIRGCERVRKGLRCVGCIGGRYRGEQEKSHDYGKHFGSETEIKQELISLFTTRLHGKKAFLSLWPARQARPKPCRSSSTGFTLRQLITEDYVKSWIASLSHSCFTLQQCLRETTTYSAITIIFNY